MKFIVTPYHNHLLKDYDRLSAFHEAIISKSRGLVYDIGAGSGILSFFAAPHSNFIFAFEKNFKSSTCAQKNLEQFPHIQVINTDVLEYKFTEKADLIICEMLDTALIDEEQVPVLNKALKYLKDNGDIIPCGVINGAELVFMKSPRLSYQDVDTPEFLDYQVKGPLIVYNKINFNREINEKVNIDLELTVNIQGMVNAIKITTFTLLTPDIICGPTPMLNPPLFIPIGELYLDEGDEIKINLSYTMGGGLDTIRTKIKRFS
ncbi:methyltransferase domain-containing protein [Methanobacterium alcaliphilum]|uniref:methyltransferase domain-containing protein n=1 Tax=Methanobacterium alcaliphilum TaxID=392018 RepID=UPI00200AEF90|nr:methyltransferase domain-containing protein [Methanobacterium alcaliphilum]MCK9150797.1 methyltransferase domain-containing protein [Methanobacterium alcaliphilum]